MEGSIEDFKGEPYGNKLNKIKRSMLEAARTTIIDEGGSEEEKKIYNLIRESMDIVFDYIEKKRKGELL